MPELPEVETTLRGIGRHILKQPVTRLVLRHQHLRWPIPAGLDKLLPGQTLRQLTRRVKYLLFRFDQGTLILHLGMSGRLRILSPATPAQKHDHVDIDFGNGVCLRFTDPRRFGALLWTTDDPSSHPLLAPIGPEPLSAAFSGAYLYEQSRHRKTAVKTWVMNSHIVAGVGNIYATEALFTARLLPHRTAHSISLQEYQRLATAIKTILKRAIAKGGTTLKDFTKSDGKPGYFRMELKVYGRGGEPCRTCKRLLSTSRLGQRGTTYCRHCQR